MQWEVFGARNISRTTILMEKFLLSYRHTENVTRPWRLSREAHLTIFPSLAVWIICLNLYLYYFSGSLPKTESLHVHMLKGFLQWIGLKLGAELEWKQPHRIPWDDRKACYQVRRMCGVIWFGCTTSRRCVTRRSSPVCTLVPSVGTALYHASWRQFSEERSSDVPLRRIQKILQLCLLLHILNKHV